jgi:hypothetical protein
MLEINKEDIMAELQAFKLRHKEQRKQFDSIISPFLSGNLNKKRSIELCQVGKFLTLLDKPTQIVEHSDSPDFIILYNGQKIGLEHERIFKEENVSKIKSVAKLFDDAAIVFKELYPNKNVLVNFWLNTDSFVFRKSEADRLKEEISKYIYYRLTNEHAVEKPSFIDHIVMMNHSQVSFCYNPGGYIVSKLDKQTLENAIHKKESLVEKYIGKSGINKQWLLIVIGSASPDSYEFSESQFDIKMKSNFEKIFLMEDFHSELWQIV